MNRHRRRIDENYSSHQQATKSSRLIRSQLTDTFEAPETSTFTSKASTMLTTSGSARANSKTNGQVQAGQVYPRTTVTMATRLLLLSLSLLAASAIPCSSTSILTRHTRSEKEFAPRLSHQPASVVLPLNEPHNIDCPVEAEPRAEVKWFKDDRQLASQPAHLDQSGNELLFMQLTEDDTGEYRCQADNYLGSIISEPFRLTVQSTSPDARIRFEPRLVEAQPEQQVEFRCSIPPPPAGQPSATPPTVAWRRDGRKLLVKWLDEGEELADARSRFVGRQLGADQFALVITRVQPKDNNTSFTCSYRYQPAEQAASELDRESSPGRLRVLLPAAESPPPTSTQVHLPAANLGAAIEDLSRRRPPLDLHKTTALEEERVGVVDRLNLAELFHIARPTLIVLAVLLLVSLLVVGQLVYIRRRMRHHNRYTKHSSSSASSSASSAAGAAPAAHLHHQHLAVACSAGSSASSSGCSSATGLAFSDCDPVLSSLMARTLSAPVRPAHAAHAPHQRPQKTRFRSYRDHVRHKVAAAAAAPSHDLVDGHAHPAVYHLGEQPLFTCALPNLYSQQAGLASREQVARTLLQSGGGHQQHLLRGSLTNLAAAAPSKHLSRAHHAYLAAHPAHLELHLDQQRQPPSWQPAEERYQLVNCATPTCSSSPASSSSSTSAAAAAAAAAPASGGHSPLPADSQTSAHQHLYSTIDACEEEEDRRYEELDPNRLLRQLSQPAPRESGRRTNTNKATSQPPVDQPSPYAVSAVLRPHRDQQQQQQQQVEPPVSSEAMRALNEQLDLKQLMELDEVFAATNPPQVSGGQLAFHLPPPPARPTSDEHGQQVSS